MGVAMFSEIFNIFPEIRPSLKDTINCIFFSSLSTDLRKNINSNSKCNHIKKMVFIITLKGDTIIVI